MAGERMIPMLPCADIDEIADFAVAIGFTVTYRQTRPNPYLALRREDLDLHYFGIDGFRPEDSYGTCGVIAPDPKLLFDAFADGLRSRYGRLPLAGFPRITRPRRRKNAEGFTGFSLIDQAAKILGGAVRRHSDGAPPGELIEALAYLLELSVRRGDAAEAREALARIDALDLSGTDRAAAVAVLESVTELRAAAEVLDADHGRP